MLEYSWGSVAANQSSCLV